MKLSRFFQLHPLALLFFHVLPNHILAADPFCSPTRAALLTGRYQQRFGHENNPAYRPDDELQGLSLAEKILPQYMKEAGYRTGWIGKWHLGATPKQTPTARGFDEGFGFIGGGHQYSGWKIEDKEYNVPITRNGEPLPEAPEQHLTDRFGEEASDFIRRNQRQPWFLYVAFNAPHTPHQPTLEGEQKFASVADPSRRKYLAQLSLMDDAVGAISSALAETGQRERTLIFFFSDNGGPLKNSAVNTPLRDGKGSVYEGGVRVPFIVSYPSQLPSDAVYDAPVSSLDVLPTALALGGVQAPSDRKLDGVNLLPYLQGKSKSAPHERLYWRTGGGKTWAVREGNWKLVRAKNNQDELYDLSKDVSESTNVWAQNKEVAHRLGAGIDAWDHELIAPAFEGPAPKNRSAKKAVK